MLTVLVVLAAPLILVLMAFIHYSIVGHFKERPDDRLWQRVVDNRAVTFAAISIWIAMMFAVSWYGATI